MPTVRLCLAGLALLATASLPGAPPLGAQVTVRCTAESYGTTTLTRCSDDTRSKSDCVGSTVYTRDNTGRRSTLDAYCPLATYRDNRGTRGTYDTYGGVTTYRDNRGTRGTSTTDGWGASTPRVTGRDAGAERPATERWTLGIVPRP